MIPLFGRYLSLSRPRVIKYLTGRLREKEDTEEENNGINSIGFAIG